MNDRVDIIKTSINNIKQQVIGKIFFPFKNNEKNEKMKIIKMYELKRELYGYSNKTHKCTYECNKNKTIECISQIYNLYGCYLGGEIHECDKLKCNVIIDNTGLYLCPISGIVIGTYINEERFSNNNNKNIYNSQYTNEDIGIYEENFSHEFNNEITNFEELKGNKRRKTIDKFEDPIYISERQRDIEIILNIILFDRNKRMEINYNLNKQNSNNGFNQVLKYYKECKKNNVRPILPKADLIFDFYKNQKTKKLLIVKHDSNIATYLQAIILYLWNIIFNTKYMNNNKKSTKNFKTYVLGSLYFFINGYSIINGNYEKITVIPKINFLKQYLPDQNYLKYFNIDTKKNGNINKKEITHGITDINKCLEEIRNENSNLLNQIILKFNQNIDN